MAKEFNDETAKEAIKENGIVILDFFAGWCMPCKMVSPIIESLSEKYKDKVEIGKINVDDNNQLATEYGVRGIPTVIFFKDGNLIDKIVGLAPQATYESKIEELIK